MFSKRFLSCDWGTSNFRLRLIQTKNFQVLAEIKSSKGISSFKEPNPFLYEEYLIESMKKINNIINTPLNEEKIIISGMASSSIGWIETPYKNLPVRLHPNDLITRKSHIFKYNHKQYQATLISGICSHNDIMRGEETEALGLLSRSEYKNFSKNCYLILTGTHSKHIQIKDATIIDFQTHMTGELFRLLSTHSIFKHNLHTSKPKINLCKKSIIRGTRLVIDNGLSSSLFKVRSMQLLNNNESLNYNDLLSGILIANELINVKDNLHPIIISGTNTITQIYKIVLSQFNLKNLSFIPENKHNLLAAKGHFLFLKGLA